MDITLRALCFVFLGTFLSAPAEARSVALVIGNGAYSNAPALINPTYDARDVGAAFERLGFEVIRVYDAEYDALHGALTDFRRTADGADVAVVFFAGHGMGVEEQSWLVPTDAALASVNAVPLETISVRSALAAVSGATRLRLVILDACRTNPFVSNMAAQNGSRGLSVGLAPLTEEDDTLVWYAAKDGSIALDGDGRNSPFTEALLRHIETPGIDISRMFRLIAQDVREGTPNQQTPSAYGSRGLSNFSFTSGRTGPGAAVAEEQAALELSVAVQDPAVRATLLESFMERYPLSPLRDDAEKALEEARRLADPAGTAWAALQGSFEAARIEQFREQFPGSQYDASARDRLATLTRIYRSTQQDLAALNFHDGAIDGVWGPQSAASLRRFERSSPDVTVNGVLELADVDALRRAASLAAAEARRMADAEREAADHPYDGDYFLTMYCDAHPRLNRGPYTQRYFAEIRNGWAEIVRSDPSSEMYDNIRVRVSRAGILTVNGVYHLGGQEPVVFQSSGSLGPLKTRGRRSVRNCIVEMEPY